jgi:hypothetical protein
MNGEYRIKKISKTCQMKYQNKKFVIIMSLVLLLVGVIIFTLIMFRNIDNEGTISPYFFISLDSIEELNNIRELFDQDLDSELLLFFEKSGGGESDIKNKKEVERFLNILETLVLPSNPNWTSLSFNYSSGNLIINYGNILYDAELMIMMEYEPTYSFASMIEEFSSTHIFNNVTEDILRVVENSLVSTDYLTVGGGIKIFEVYPRGEQSRFIIEDEYGCEVGTILDVSGKVIEATVSYASSIEDAFEILASMMFMLNPW